jgi:drug/metabolite transporter (DMT)-like permease
MGRRRLIVTGAGSSQEAYATIDWLVLVAISLIWGASFLFIAVGLESIDPRVIAWSRLILGCAALVPFQRARRRIDPEDRARIVVAGVAGAAAPAILFAWAEQTVPSALAGMLVAGVPMATAIIATALTRRRPRGPQMWGIAVGFGGVLLLVSPDLTGDGATPIGITMIILAVFGYALANNMYPPLQQRYGAIATMFWAQLAALVALTPLGVTGISSTRLELRPVLAVLALGVLGTGLARVLHVSLAGRVGAARASLGGYTIPIVALALGVMVLGEVVEVVQVIGVLIAVSSAWLISRRER